MIDDTQDLPRNFLYIAFWALLLTVVTVMVLTVLVLVQLMQCVIVLDRLDWKLFFKFLILAVQKKKKKTCFGQ